MKTGKKIYFIPRYIGALKYFEKLFPALVRAGFEPSFLLFEDTGMVAYCKDRSLACDRRFLPPGRMHIPFFTPIADDLFVRRRIDGFLAENPRGLVTEPIVSQRVRGLFAVAQKKGIRTVSLQWAQHPNRKEEVRRTFMQRYLALRDRYRSAFGVLIKGSYAIGRRALYRVLDAVMGGNVFIHTDFHVDRLGLIDESLRDYFKREGWTEEQMRVVGFADFTLMHERAVEIKQDSGIRAKGLERLKLSTDKKIILLVSTPFYTGRDAVFLDRAGQREYYLNIIKDIRAVYGIDEAVIVLKMHPREENLYGDLSDNGVRVFGNEADLDELIALSDLYIAHPLTAANFIVKASATPALFINFTPLPYLNAGKEIYHLKEIYTSHDAFQQALVEQKRGTLPSQYDSSDVDLDSLRKITTFIVG